MKPDLVFVYGTLKRGHGNHRVMQRAAGEFIGEAITVERFPLVVDGLPYLLDSSGEGHHVIGELYRVSDDAGWSYLDRLEGHPTFYRRRVISCEVDGVVMDAWVYFLQAPDRRLRELEAVREYTDRMVYA
ncbi:gamma-glutamylaminecyclotransferase [Ectothiorhodospira magna]|uniref:Gamma-glutamylcyclotransferase family protein n=1 Tax=Ectothiorhodospira magna TaxID=867345 RepID=A0A1H9GCZ1_9GAMM|nr:gamma-glutamylcyclotransferase family protein [Ectothiorhodospira magna]SEQ47964.1 gamma-glutamylaminecyclotransferase [Ectothiorhodospira magna]